MIYQLMFVNLYTQNMLIANDLEVEQGVVKMWVRTAELVLASNKVIHGGDLGIPVSNRK